MRECESEDNEDSASVRWMPYIGIKSGGDELVLVVHGQVDREELPKGMEAVDGDVSTQKYGEDADDEEWCSM